MRNKRIRLKDVLGRFSTGAVVVPVVMALGGCAAQNCDPTGGMAAQCTPMKAYVFTGEAFEEDKMFYYRNEEARRAELQDIPATELSRHVLKGKKGYDTVWSRDGQTKKAIFYRRPLSF